MNLPLQRKETRGARRKARELSLQVLFQLDTGAKDQTPEEAFSLFCRSFDAPPEARNYAWELVVGVRQHLNALDAELNQASEHWRLDRMSVVDRNILRLALYEMRHLPDVPLKVSLNEAIDLGKKYGTEESGAFINGVLDRIHHQLAGEAPSASETGDASEG